MANKRYPALTIANSAIQLAQAKKNSSGTITKGQVVYSVGYDATNDLYLVELAKADSGSTMPSVGIAYDTFTEADSGTIILSGNLQGFDTSSYSVNQELYVSAAVAGALTSTKPSSVYIEKIAIVINSHASNGVIQIYNYGSDDPPLTLTAPENVTKATAAVGTSGEAARRDHKHDVTTTTASSLSVGGSNAEGTSTSLARADHTHSLPAFGSSAGTFCQGADSRLGDSRAPNGSASGDLAGSYPSPTVAQSSTAFALSGVISPSSIGSSQNDYTPTGLSTASFIRLTSSAAYNITGLTGGAAGRVITLHNYGSYALTLKDESSSSTAANRFALTADFVLNTDEACTLQYDGTSARWRIIGAARVPYGTAANTVCQGSDSRLSDDRTASGLRSATTVVAVSSATAPSTGQVLMATANNAATWQTPSSAGEVNTASNLGAGAGAFAQKSGVDLQFKSLVSGTNVNILNTSTEITIASTNGSNAPLTSTAPVNVTKATASAGTALEASRQDHKHDVTTATPTDIGIANSEGTATSLARSDHVHKGQILQSSFTEITVDTTRSSTSFGDLLTITLTTSASTKLNIWFTTGFSNSTAEQNTIFQLVIDGAAVRGFSGYIPKLSGGTEENGSIVYRKTELSAASHTIKIQWKVDGGTGQIRPVTTIMEHASLLIQEVTV